VAAPVFSSSTPADGATNVYLNQKLEVTFSTDLDATSVSGATVILRSVVLDTVVDATLSVSGAKITIVPYTLLIANSVYRLTLVGSDLSLSTGAIQSADGSLVDTEILSFQIGSQLDTTSVTRTEEEITLGGDLNLPGDISLTSSSLTLASSTPTNHAFGVATTTDTIQLTFSAALKISDISTGTTVIPDACNSFSLARMVWNAAGRAPIAPTRAFDNPLTTRQTLAKRITSFSKTLLFILQVCSGTPVSV